MHAFNIAQALLWICNSKMRKFDEVRLNAKLAFLEKPFMYQGTKCPPSLTAVALMFSKGVFLPNATSWSDVTKSLKTDVTDPAAAVFQSAHDELLQILFNCKLAMCGHPVPKGASLIPFVASFGYWPGCEPAGPSEVIRANEFAELRFVDREGIEAVPKDPAREFPRWRDLWVAADDVRRLWPIETPDAGKKRGPAPALTESVKARMRQYDPGELAKMKGSEMASTFGASATICYAARRSVQSELKTPCNSE